MIFASKKSTPMENAFYMGFVFGSFIFAVIGLTIVAMIDIPAVAFGSNCAPLQTGE